MKISELIRALESLKLGRGDLQVYACPGIGDERPIVGSHGTQGNNKFITLVVAPRK